MLTTLPAPVLSVTHDAVKDLQGQDALSALWTSKLDFVLSVSFLTLFLVFTKCKESLQDGRRLENISWRLWHRELILAQQSYLPPTPDSVSIPKVSSDTRNSFFPLTDPVKVVQPSGMSEDHFLFRLCSSRVLLVFRTCRHTPLPASLIRISTSSIPCIYDESRCS
jgi:hypothetical protein